MEDTLDPLDRATMATWKASNVLMWGGVALGCALVLHTVGDELVRRLHIPNLFTMNGRPTGFQGTFWGEAPQYGYRAFFAILVGILIGAVVGSKVVRARTQTAMLVAAGYVLITWLAIETSLRLISASGVVPAPNGAFAAATIGETQHGLPGNAREWAYSLLALLAVAIAPLVAGFVAKRRDRRAVSSGTLG